MAAPIETVKRTALGVEIRREGHWEVFDEVVFATHSDDSLAMLADPTPTESAALGAVRYQPKHRGAACRRPRDAQAPRSTWSELELQPSAKGHEGGPIDLTYWMELPPANPGKRPAFRHAEQPRADRRELDL